MTITQESAQKALDAVKCAQNVVHAFEPSRGEKTLTLKTAEHKTICAALQYFAQPSGEGVITQGSMVYNPKHYKVVDTDENNIVPKSPASPPDAVAQAIEAIDIAVAALWKVATTITKIGGGEVLDNAVSYLAAKGDAEIAIEKIKSVLPEDAYNQLKALRTLPARQDGWKTMETAPMDWSDILLYVPDSEENSDVMQGYYSCWDGGDDCWNSFRNERIYPTHWQPLPAPPSTPAAAMDGEGV